MQMTALAMASFRGNTQKCIDTLLQVEGCNRVCAAIKLNSHMQSLYHYAIGHNLGLVARTTRIHVL